MSSRSPSVSTPSPLRVASGRVVKKYLLNHSLLALLLAFQWQHLSLLAFSAELDRGYCLQAQLQSAAFRSSYVLGNHVAQCLPNQLRFGRDRYRRHTVPGTDCWSGPDRYSARAHRCGAGRALISGLR